MYNTPVLQTSGFLAMPIRVERGKQVVQQVRHWTRGPLLYHVASVAIFEGIDNDSPDNQKIAAKCVPLQDTEALRLLTNERKILEKLSDCPNVIQFLGTSISDHVKEFGDKRTMNLFLEYLPKGNLQRLLQSCEGKKLSEPVSKRFTRDLVHALAYMHRMGVVHGNINSSNVLLGDRCVKLCDFGLSWDFANQFSNQIPRLMEDYYKQLYHQQKTPENFFNKPRLTPAIDSFSLGCLVCEMLTGRRARLHDSSTSGPQENKVQGSNQFSNLVVEIPKKGWENIPDAHDFVTKCLIKEPKLRWKAEQLLNHPWIQDVDDLTVTVEMNRLHTLRILSENKRRILLRRVD